MDKQQLEEIQKRRELKTPRERVDYYNQKLEQQALAKKIKNSRKYI
jgi:hypothetical protein